MDPILIALGYLEPVVGWIAPAGALASEATSLLTRLAALEAALQEYAIDSRATEVQGIVLDHAGGRSQLLAEGARLLGRLSEIAQLKIRTNRWGNLSDSNGGYGHGSVFRPV